MYRLLKQDNKSTPSRSILIKRFAHTYIKVNQVKLVFLPIEGRISALPVCAGFLCCQSYSVIILSVNWYWLKVLLISNKYFNSCLLTTILHDSVGCCSRKKEWLVRWQNCYARFCYQYLLFACLFFKFPQTKNPMKIVKRRTQYLKYMYIYYSTWKTYSCSF